MTHNSNHISGTVYGEVTQIAYATRRSTTNQAGGDLQVTVTGAGVRVRSDSGDTDILDRIVAHLTERLQELTPLLPHTQGAVDEIQSVMDLISSLSTS